MTEAGQIFALLRSASAAELAKRFNSVDESALPPAQSGPRPGVDAVRPGPAAPGGNPAGGTATGAGPGTASGSPGAQPVSGGAPTAAATTGHPASTPAQGLEIADAFAASHRPAALRAALSLASLAPPRADLIRFLTDAASSGLHRMPGAGSAPMTGAESAASGLPGVARPGAAPGAPDVLRPAEAGSGAAIDSETTTQAFVSQPAVRAAAALAAGLGALMMQPEGAADSGPGPAPDPGEAVVLRPGAAGSAQTAGAPAAGSALVPTGQATGAAVAPGVDGAVAADAAAIGTASSAAASVDASIATARTVTAAQVAFAEAVIALIDAAGGGRTGSVASGVIFNAAMIPGWPFPSAFAKDGPEGINPKALLHRLATAVEGMSPQEAAEYLATIGGGYAFLRNLRRILRELDMVGKEDVKGLLFSFLETLSSIASGLQTAFKLMAESAALQAAVAHGEVPEDGERPGRRRLRL